METATGCRPIAVRGPHSRSSSPPGEEKDAYLDGEPASDARFVESFAHLLEHAGGYSPNDAKRTAETLFTNGKVTSGGVGPTRRSAERVPVRRPAARVI